MLIPPRIPVPTLPARSVACPVADRFAPSAASVCGGLSVPGATPDNASAAAKVTTTGARFQPSAFGEGAEVAVTTGDVLSRFSVTLALALLPAVSVAVPDTT